MRSAAGTSALEMVEGASSSTTLPLDGRPPARGWPSNRFVFVVFWGLAALLSAAPFAAIPEFADQASAQNFETARDDWRFWQFAISAVFAAPLIETACIALPVIWLRHHRVRDSLLILVGAGIVALTHQSFASSALAVFPPFLIYAYVYVKRSKAPFNDGYWLAAAVHSFYNLAIVAALMLYRYQSPS